LIAAASAVAEAAADGEITPGEAASLSTLVANTAKAVETFELADQPRQARRADGCERKHAMSLRQRLESLEQTLLPGRFLVLRLDPARDRREQIEAFRAENGVTARDTLVILLSFFTSEELQEAERQSA
jgi:hypothetical protein